MSEVDHHEPDGRDVPCSELRFRMVYSAWGVVCAFRPGLLAAPKHPRRSRCGHRQWDVDPRPTSRQGSRWQAAGSLGQQVFHDVNLSARTTLATPMQMITAFPVTAVKTRSKPFGGDFEKSMRAPSRRITRCYPPCLTGLVKPATGIQHRQHSLKADNRFNVGDNYHAHAPIAANAEGGGETLNSCRPMPAGDLSALVLAPYAVRHVSTPA